MQLSFLGNNVSPSRVQHSLTCHTWFVKASPLRLLSGSPALRRPAAQQHGCLQIRAAAADAYAQSAGKGDDSNGEQASLPPAPAQPRGLWQKVKAFFMGDKLDKQRLAALGLGAVASYGFVSNVTYGTGAVLLQLLKLLTHSCLAQAAFKNFCAGGQRAVCSVEQGECLTRAGVDILL